jgi:biopolymer transport protein ExbD
VALAAGAIGLVLGAAAGVGAALGVVALPLARAAPPSIKVLEIELPHSAVAIETLARRDALVIEIAADGQVYLAGELMTTKTLRARLRQESQARPDRWVQINADRKIAYQHVCYVLDLLQFEGLKGVFFRTRD